MTPPDATTGDLFEGEVGVEALGPGAVLLRGFAGPLGDALLAGIAQVAAASAFRHLTVRSGARMSVAMTNCGDLGWVSDRSGYRYDPRDPETGRPWPAMPADFASLARRAAEAAGYPDYAPEACLVNRYAPGARLSLHQDRDEQAVRAPIVSVSLGLPATFLWGGLSRSDPTRRLRLAHGDVAVWGGPSRMVYHGVAPLADGAHAATGQVRYNLTFRRVRP
jgi:DNA oxidative demethylase